MWRRRQAAAGVRETVDLPHERRELARLDRPFRLAVAWDEAFSFYDQANLDLLAQMGMDLVYFSSMRDRALPDDGAPSRFGYVQVEDRTGLRFPAHEFHHAVAEPLDGARMAYNVRKAGAPQRAWACGFEKKRTLAAFAHAHFLSHPELVRRFWG